MLSPPPLPRTLDACLRDLSSERKETRASAVKDLVVHAASSDATRTRAIPLLEKALSDDAAPVRSAAAVALADLQASEALPKLLVAVEDPDLHVRQMALNALGEIGDVRAAPRLRRALTDDRPEVRYQAVIAFARVADAADVTAALKTALEDDDDAVRYIALRVAEEKIENPHLEPVERGAFLALTDRAKVLLGDGSDHVAIAAALFLAKLGDDAAKPPILKAIRGDGKKLEKEDERAAVEMAGELDLRDAVPDLERRAWGVKSKLFDTCAFHAKIALARLGHERAVLEITRDLGSSDREARTAAVVAAGRARLTEAKKAIEQLSPDAIDPRLRKTALEEIG
ncbi:MAG: HEAT repeat domain-containing protein [Polyangiaceae bacterium]